MQFEGTRPLNLTLLASLFLHAALLSSLLWLGLMRAAAREVDTQPAWNASGVEVGIVPTAPPEPNEAPSPPSPPEPASPTSTTPSPIAEPSPRPIARPSKGPDPHVTAPPPAVARAAPSVGTVARAAPSVARANTSDSAAPAEPNAVVGSLGALGLPVGIQHFARAFSWALPEGGHRDRAWSELPLGAIGKAVIDVTINEEGRIESVEFDPQIPAPPPALKRMIDHALFLLRPRRFSLDAKTVDVGVERLVIDVTLSQEAPHGDEDENPLALASEGHKPPEGDRAGYARFTLNSGRHLEASLRREARR